MSSNQYSQSIERRKDYLLMSLDELNRVVDGELIEEALPDLLRLPVDKRPAAIESFAAIDPDLARKLALALCLAVS